MVLLTIFQRSCYNAQRMSQAQHLSETESKKRGFNLTLAVVAGQVGCLTTFIIIAALLAGLWLDNQLGSKPLVTISLVVASVPVTLLTMIWVVRTATARMTNPNSHPAHSPHKEELNRE